MPPETSPPLRIHLFGLFGVERGGAPLMGLRLREGERLLAYLLLHRENPVPYRKLAQLFWPSEARAVAGFSGEYRSTRQAIYVLRQTLGPDAARLVSEGKGLVRLDADGLDADIVEFEAGVRSEDPEQWRRAALRYRGPLLEGWTDSWAAEARERCRRSYERTLQRLIHHAREAGDDEDLARWLERAIASLPDSDDLRAELDRLAKKRASVHSTADSRAESRQVMLLYKRGAEPDETVMRLLERELAAAGWRVFVDVNMPAGVEWAREIERRIAASHAVIPLLSAPSIRSEMLEFEVEKAREAAWSRGGAPRLLPVRVAYAEPLPDGALASILNPLQYALWRNADDDARLVEEILRGLETPAALPPPLPLEPVGGAVPIDSRFYIERAADRTFATALARRDSIVLVKGARQIGKTSLLARGLQQARESGARVVRTDFQKLNEAQLASPESLFIALAASVARQLKLDVSPRDAWDPDAGPNMNLDLFMENAVLESFPEPLVWGMDEVDRLFTCPFGSEVFGLLRSWHNERSLNPAGPWKRLTLAIAYATEAHLFITDLTQSPFNVGTRLALEDFSLDQVAELNRRYGSPLRDDVEVERFYSLVSGQPYLTRRGLDEMAQFGETLERLESEGSRDEGVFGDHLRRIMASLSRDPDLMEVMRGVLRGLGCPTPESFFRLRSAGLLSGDASVEARPRCPLYAAYLGRHLL